MQLGVSFSTLLVSLLVSLFVLDDVAAAPYKRGPAPGSVTLSLRRIPPRNDIHPELVSLRILSPAHLIQITERNKSEVATAHQPRSQAPCANDEA